MDLESIALCFRFQMLIVENICTAERICRNIRLGTINVSSQPESTRRIDFKVDLRDDLENH